MNQIKYELIVMKILSSIFLILLFFSCSNNVNTYKVTYEILYPEEKIVLSEIIENNDSIFKTVYNPSGVYGYYTIEDNSGRFYKREKYPIIIKNIEEVTKNE